MNSIIILMLFLIFIGFILAGMLGKDKIMGEVFLKITLVIIITLIGGAITCGGNIAIDNIFPHSGGYGSPYVNELFIFWAVEIVAIFIFSIWFLFFRKENLRKIGEKIKNIDDCL